MTQRIHVSLSVSELDRSVAFYEQLFGQPVSKRKSDYANFRLEAPPIHLALLAAGGPVTAYPGHHGVEVESADELESWRRRSEGASSTTRIEHDVTCCYARTDKVWVQDPDGNDWEVWVRKADAETMSEPEAVDPCCVGGCCG